MVRHLETLVKSTLPVKRASKGLVRGWYWPNPDQALLSADLLLLWGVQHRCVLPTTPRYSHPPDTWVDMSPTRGSNFWGPRESIFQVRHSEVQLFFKKAYYGGWWDSNSRPKTHVLSSSPFVKAFVRWVTGNRLTHRLPELSLITPSPSGTTGFEVCLTLFCTYFRTIPPRSALRSHYMLLHLVRLIPKPCPGSNPSHGCGSVARPPPVSGKMWRIIKKNMTECAI